jgi:hypothetical protein
MCTVNYVHSLSLHKRGSQDIIPFVWDHWDMICTKRSKTGSWKNNLATKLATETRLFREEETGSQRFGLVDQVHVLYIDFRQK